MPGRLISLKINKILEKDKIEVEEKMSRGRPWTRPWTLYKFLKILTMILSSMINIYFNLVFF